MRERDSRKPRGDHSDGRDDSDDFFRLGVTVYTSDQHCVLGENF